MSPTTTSNPTSNLAWTVPSHASTVHDLTRLPLPVPTPGPSEVLVRITAISLNYRDLIIATRSPLYPGTHKADLVPCCDGAGVIHAAGAGSTWAGKEGERVLLHPNVWLNGDVRNLEGKFGDGCAEYDGYLQEWVVIADERVIRAPGHLSAVENAALATAGVTAWSAIREGLDMVLTGEMREWRDGKRLEGKTILTQGTGGVSCFAIQIAAALGATVIVTSSSDEKLALAKELGATHGINYKTHPDWDLEVKRLTNGAGVDHVIELGGAQTLMKSVASVRVGGLISVIGILSAPQDIPGHIIPALLFGGITVKGCVAFSRDATADFARFVEQHGIKPLIAKVFEYQDATAAFEAMQNQSEVGKIVIKVSDE